MKCLTNIIFFCVNRAYDNARTPVDLPTFRQLDATPEMAIAELNSTLNTVVIVHDHGGDKSSTLISVLIDGKQFKMLVYFSISPATNFSSG